MKLAALLISSLFLSSAMAEDGRFSMGNRFVANSIIGQVYVHCVDGSSAVYNCRDSALDPSSYDYFVGPTGSGADEVFLDNLRADGTRRERTAAYSSNTGKSGEAFNLWISTIFQRPLLAMGLNKVTYSLKASGKTLAVGNFDVKVVSGQLRECPVTHYNSSDNNDCQSQYTVCQQYFEQYQYCR